MNRVSCFLLRLLYIVGNPIHLHCITKCYENNSCEGLPNLKLCDQKQRSEKRVTKHTGLHPREPMFLFLNVISALEGKL